MAQTVLLVDDDCCFREIARALLAVGGFDVVGEACSGAAALSAARDLRPDVVLRDIQLPDTDGFAITWSLTQAEDRPCVVLCSARAAQDYDCGGDRFGASGFLTKAHLSAEALHQLVTVDRLA